MNSPENESQVLTEKRGALLRAIGSGAPRLVDVYKSGLRLAADDTFPARPMLLAHVVRELKNRLPDAFVPAAPRLDYRREFSLIRPMLLRSLANIPSTSSLEAEIPIRVVSARQLKNLFIADENVETGIKKRFLEMCAIVSRESVRWAGNELLATRWAKISTEGIAHNGDIIEADKKAKNAFSVIEGIMLSIFAYAADRERDLNALAQRATKENVKEHQLQLVTLRDFDVYFSKIKDPDLFEPLQNAKTFVIADNDHSYWPKANYLKAIATQRSQPVAMLLKDLAATTSGITRQLLSIATLLADADFVLVMSKAKWLRRPPSFEYFDPLLQALRRLVEIGEKNIAFRYSRAMFVFEGEERPKRFSPFDRLRAVPVIDSHLFTSAMERVPEILAAKWPLHTLEMLQQSLDQAIAIEDYDYDHHGFWFENFLDPETHRYDARAQLTGGVFDMAATIAQDDVASVLAFFDGLKENRTLYLRMSDAITFRFGTDAMVGASISDYSEWTFSKEHLALVERGFGALTLETRSRIMEVVYESQRKRVVSFLTENSRDLSETDSILDAEVAKLLGKVLDDVPEPFKSKLLLAVAATEAFDERRDPPTFEEMERLDPVALGALLEEWIPDGSEFLHGSWGIGGHLRLVIERHSENWLKSEANFAAIPDYFLGWALNGLLVARRGAFPFDLRVMQIIVSTIGRATSIAKIDSHGRETGRHMGQNAGQLLVEETRRALTRDTLLVVLSAAESLESLNLEEPTSSMTPWSAPGQSLGSPSALAVDVVGEAFSVAYNQKIDCPEIRSSYSRMVHTDVLPARAQLAHFFTWFATLYPDGAMDWAKSLFYSENDDGNRAAWAGFIQRSNATQATRPALQAAYAKYLRELVSLRANAGEERLSSDVETALEHTLWHIWVFVANQIEPLDAPDSLGNVMLEIVSDSDLEHLLSSIGSGLTDATLDATGNAAKINTQAMRFWTRVEDDVAAGKRGREALHALPTWLTSPLDPDWRFAAAEKMVRDSTMRPTDAWKAIKALVGLSAFDKIRSLTIIDELLKPPQPETLTAVQQFAGDLLRSAYAGTTEERHLANLINSHLMTNHRPNMLADDEGDVS